MSTRPETLARNVFAAEGLTPQTWSSDPGFVYGEHQHPYHKVLFCISGSITFHTPDGDVRLTPGDRLDLQPNTPHGATVGSEGVRCMEAPRG